MSDETTAPPPDFEPDTAPTGDVVEPQPPAAAAAANYVVLVLSEFSGVLERCGFGAFVIEVIF